MDAFLYLVNIKHISYPACTYVYALAAYQISHA